MAANSKSLGIASLGKRFVNQIWTGKSCDPTQLSAVTFSRRGTHSTVYEKNPDEHVRPHVVPDELIQPESDKYWAPHPQTGVFGPVAEHTKPAGGDRIFHSSSAGNGGGDSVLEQKAWFRPTSIEDLEKPHQP